MPIGPDRVQVITQASAALGGDSADSPYDVPLNATEDAIESAGGYVQAPGETRDETVGWYRHVGELVVFDQSHPSGVSLAALTDRAYRRHFLLMGA